MYRTEISLDYERGHGFTYERLHVYALWHGGGEFALIQSWPNDHEKPNEREPFKTHEELSSAFETRQARLKADGWTMTRGHKEEASWTPPHGTDYKSSTKEWGARNVS